MYDWSLCRENKPSPPPQVQEKGKCFVEWLGQSHSGTCVFSGIDMTLQAMAWELAGQGRKYTNSGQIRLRFCFSTVWLGERHGPSLSLIHLSVQVYLCYHITTKSCQETNFFLLKMINKTHIGMENTSSVSLFRMPTEHSNMVSCIWMAGRLGVADKNSQRDKS